MPYVAGVGAGADYQIVVHCYYGTGASGTETLNGELVNKVYLDDGFGAAACKASFDDVRFALAGSDTVYTYKRTSKTDGVDAVFVVKVSDSMDAARSIYCYYGNSAAADVSSDNALVDVIANVVLGLPLNEGAGLPQDYSGNAYHADANTADWATGGKFGNYLQFTAANSDKVIVEDLDSYLNGKTAYSMVCWANYTTLQDNKALIGWWYNNNNNLRVNNASVTFHWHTAAGTNNIAEPHAFNDGDWHFIAGVYSTDDKVRVDDSTVAGAGIGDALVCGDRFAIGSFQSVGGDSGGYYDGGVSSVIVFDAALSTDELNNLAAGYGDVTLVAGSCLVRKWATTTLPTPTGASAVETYREETPKAQRSRYLQHRQRNRKAKRYLSVMIDFFELKQKQRELIS